MDHLEEADTFFYGGIQELHALAANENLSDTTIELFLETPEVAHLIVGNRLLSKEQLRRAVQDYPNAARVVAASMEDAELLALCLTHHDAQVHQAAFSNKATPLELLLEIARRGVFARSRQAALTTHPEVLEALHAAVEVPYILENVRAEIACNPNISKALARTLSFSESSIVRESLSANPNVWEFVDETFSARWLINDLPWMRPRDMRDHPHWGYESLRAQSSDPEAFDTLARGWLSSMADLMVATREL